jgi:hypothetical protein
MIYGRSAGIGISRLEWSPSLGSFGIPDELTRVLGVLGLACTILYAIPRTSILGAILLTAFLGFIALTV